MQSAARHMATLSLRREARSLLRTVTTQHRYCRPYMSSSFEIQTNCTGKLNQDALRPTHWSGVRYASNDVNTNFKNYFEILGVETSYGVPIDDVKASYKKMMGQYHPDVSDTTYQKTDEEEQATVVTDVTKAYEVLKHPYERALHLLQIYGHAIEEGDTMTDMIDHEFLLNVMELRQNVESAENDPERKILMEQNLDRLVQTTDALKEAFAKEQYASAKKMTAELRYWTRIDEQLREDIDEL